MQKTLYILAVIFLIAPLSVLTAQDIHFSQYLNSPMNLGPGMTGVYGGDVRFTGNYRNQWNSVPVPYTTFSGVVENKFYPTKLRYDRFFTGGVVLNYDKQGSLDLTSIQVGIPVSYTIPLVKRAIPVAHNFLTVGVLPLVGQRSFGTSNATFDAQYINRMFNMNNDPMESELSTTSLNYFDLSAGVNYRWQAKAYRSKVDMGLGWHHINRPSHDFWQGGEKVRLASRISVYSSLLFQIRPMVDLVAQGNYQRQGGYREFVSGAGARFHINRTPYHEFALQAGMNLRQTNLSLSRTRRDALIAQVEAHWRTWTVGLSYDFAPPRFSNNTENARIITNGYGGPEVAVIYRLYKVKPLSKFKSCPII